MSPIEVANQLSHLAGFAFFDSSGNIPKHYPPALSIIGALPEETIQGNLKDLKALQDILEKNSITTKAKIDIPLGGLCGWIEYEGDFSFGLYRNFLIFHHGKKEWYEIGNLLSLMKTPKNAELSLSAWKQEMREEEFLEKVKTIQKYILAGDIYQANLSQKFSCEFVGDSLFPLYQKLRLVSPSPMSAWLQNEEKQILSTSPETFLRFENRKISSRPIKGTRPRGKIEKEDQKFQKELIKSSKENAELLMIVDMQRNDLGKICKNHSVEVKSTAQLETFAQVHHLVGHIEGELQEKINPISAVASCFPAASITGAPKKRACEIIKELETKPRGVYTGILGYFGFNGMSQFNVAIRTLSAEKQKISYDVGSGIVSDSNPYQEYQESMHKGRGIQLACREFQNFT